MSFKYHIVYICAPSWGHCRPSVPISFKIVKERPDILVTYPVIGKFKERMDKEVSRYCIGENSALKDNIRVVKISDFDGGEFQYWDLIASIAPEFVRKLCVREPMTCSTGQTYPIAPKPNLCLVDFVLSPLGLNLMKDEKIDTRIWCWCAGSMLAILDVVGPGYLVDEAKELAKKTNKSIREAVIELSLTSNDKVIKLPGLAPAYVYELMGEHNIPGADEFLIDLKIQLADFFRQSHGLLMANTPIMEEGCVNFTKQWLGRNCYALGPSMLPGEVEFNKEESSKGRDVVTFLNRVYNSHGKNSLLYMSFGTSAFPNGDTPWQLIGIILDMKIPFIFAMPHGDTYENILPPELGNRLESSELTLVTKWAPQQTILNHPVTGIFFTHAGQGSITESLALGVPMIIWPLQADQPYNAMNLTLNLKVAYQLLEVRINHGLKPLYRGYKPKGTKEAIDTEFRQVLKDAFGSDGDAKRKAAFDISRQLKETWEEGDGATVELRRMLQENFL
ncbi:hypothetical protein Clacol_005211 [Clathrus columnatus]|uniref:Glycosyltransferase family 1 protein n=1 Tax=Clathrus columnatus TaxID=1419009 RepID=A0AAV5A8N1_9AGAM|nr:hypothetical protein Clacol_005211 [Clathrus columnatus]